MRFALITALLLSLSTLSVSGQTLKGPAIDGSFTIIPFGRGLDFDPNKPVYHSLVYLKLIEHEGRVAVCGGYTSRSFDGPSRSGWLRKAAIGTNAVILTNLKFMQRLQRFGRPSLKGRNYHGHFQTFNLSHSFGAGLPSKCKVSNIAWAPGFARQAPQILWPTVRYRQVKG